MPPPPVARLTGLGRAFHDALNVAIGAFHGTVPPHQREIRIVMTLNQVRWSLLGRSATRCRRGRG
jgi:hypothetical protein